MRAPSPTRSAPLLPSALELLGEGPQRLPHSLDSRVQLLLFLLDEVAQPRGRSFEFAQLELDGLEDGRGDRPAARVAPRSRPRLSGGTVARP
jgi:hypothetical protein